jgi:hypothetical protein
LNMKLVAAAHKVGVNSRQRSTSAAFGAKRTVSGRAYRKRIDKYTS